MQNSNIYQLALDDGAEGNLKVSENKQSCSTL
jgi:hypothetical protein